MKYAAPALLLLTGLLLAPAPEASAESHTAFQGSCTLAGGETRFEPGISMQPRQVAISADATGHCTGTLTAAAGEQRQLSREPVRTTVDGTGTHSCLGGTTLGTVHLDIAGERIDYTFRLTQLTAVVVVALRGVGGGAANSVFVPDLAPNNIGMALGCAHPTDQSVITGALHVFTTSALVG